MIVSPVTVYFDPSGSSADQGPAANMHVYIDLQSGAMSYLRTDARGVLNYTPSSVPATPRRPPPRIASLDDSRTYRIVISATALPTSPAVADGLQVQVSAGQILVRPHVTVRLTDSAGNGVGNVTCRLSITGSTAGAASTTSVTSNPRGWIFASDRSDGQFTLNSTTHLLKQTADPVPQATLALAPTSPVVVRGALGAIRIALPSSAVGTRVIEWRCEVNHTNPGAAAGSVATIRRPERESQSTFDQSWEGVLCASGVVTTLFVVGVTLRNSGSSPVSAVVHALPPAQSTLVLSVASRTGSAWESGLTEDAEQPLNRAINSFHDTGQHAWNSGNSAITAASPIASGPNRGCEFVETASVAFTSTPRINSLLTNAASAFSRAQDKAYLTQPPPVRVVPGNLYTVGAQGLVNITNITAFSQAMNIGPGVQFRISGHCIDQPRLLAGTRRHEFQDATASHKANCLKARRALDPVRFAEGLVRVPGGAALNFRQLFQARINAIMSAAPTHDVDDETATQAAHAVRFIAGRSILGVNSDNNGTLIGPVWNPATNSQLT